MAVIISEHIKENLFKACFTRTHSALDFWLLGRSALLSGSLSSLLRKLGGESG